MAVRIESELMTFCKAQFLDAKNYRQFRRQIGNSSEGAKLLTKMCERDYEAWRHRVKYLLLLEKP